MTSDELRAWMATHGYSVRRLAKALGVESSTVHRWRTGDHDIPPYLALALTQLTTVNEGETTE
jgi:transcriptional regulator with XRE-family HTH domain